MKLTSFTRNGTHGYGVVVADGIIDLTTTIDGVSDLKDLLESDRLAQASESTAGRSADFPLEDIEFLPLIPNASKVICLPSITWLTRVKPVGLLVTTRCFSTGTHRLRSDINNHY